MRGRGPTYILHPDPLFPVLAICLGYLALCVARCCAALAQLTGMVLTLLGE